MVDRSLAKVDENQKQVENIASMPDRRFMHMVMLALGQRDKA